MDPTKCLSSYLTTELLKFRNPQGAEENWLNAPVIGGTDSLYLGRVVTTEIGVALICITTIIENFAYAIFFVSSLPMLIVSRRPFDASKSLISSSSFTLYWNFANLTYFNLFYTNVFTEESFARYSFDHLPQGRAFKTILAVASIGVFVLSVVVAFVSRNTQVLELSQWGFMGMELSWDIKFVRSQDVLFIAQWFLSHPINVPPDAFNGVNPMNQLIGAVGDVKASIDEGAAFLKEFILDAEEVDEEIKNRVLDYDADIYAFVVTRSIYIYVFESKREDSAPNFFKFETRGLIQQLRQKYQKDEGTGLKPLMENLTSFNTELGEDQKQLKDVFNAVRSAAYGELQNSLFVTKCWEKACLPQE